MDSEMKDTIALMSIGPSMTDEESRFYISEIFKGYNKRKKEIWKDINEATGTYEKHAKKDIIKTILKFSIPISLASIIAISISSSII